MKAHTGEEMADLTSSTRNDLADNEFALLAEKKLPLPDKCPSTLRKVKSKAAAKSPGIGQGSRRSTSKPSLKKRG